MIKAEIINIGDELLIGQVINTNAGWIAQQLNPIGIHVQQTSVISDDASQIIQALTVAAQRAEIIIITGGLGPTKDDLTKHTMCTYFNATLVRNAEVVEDVKKLFSSRGLPLTDLNYDQALVPDNCMVLRNPCGTAPGMWFDHQNCIYVSLPGVPYEMQAIMTNSVIPLLQKKWTLTPLVHRTIHTFGIGESFLADKIKDWEEQLPSYIKLAYLPSFGLVRLRLSSTQQYAAQVKAEEKKLMHLIDEFVFGYDADTLESVVINLLAERKQSLATAESCTGGYIAHLITSIPGSSVCFKGAVIAYDNSIKQDLLHVDKSNLDEFGAVSEAVVKQMAEGVKTKMKTDYAIAVSGIAGPSGGTATKPVGTICMAIATPLDTFTYTYQFSDNRERNIKRTANTALFNLIQKIRTTS